MFTIDQIKQAHSKVKSGADFPKYIQELIKLGIRKYDNYVMDGHTQYIGKGDFQVLSEDKYLPLNIAVHGDKNKLSHNLKIHQQGQTDYLTFCNQAAEAGVYKWTVDLENMTCTYFDKEGNEMLVEGIPER